MNRKSATSITIFVGVVVIALVGEIWYYLQLRGTTTAQSTIEIQQEHLASQGSSSASTPNQSTTSTAFYNSTTCAAQIVAEEIDPSIASAATATVLRYCPWSPTAMVYGTINNANYFSNEEIVNGDLYITKASNPTTTMLYDQPTIAWRQNQVWLYRGSAVVRLIYSLPRSDSSSIVDVSVSPDENLLALGKDNEELDIVTTGGTLLKSLADMPSGEIVAGWGRDSLWMNQGSLDAPVFMRINLTDWSMRQYSPAEGGVLTGDMALNFDMGELAISDFPWLGDATSYFQFLHDSTTTLSLFLDNLITGATETVATEKVTALGGPFNPRWLDDNTLRYNISSTGTATTSVH